VKHPEVSKENEQAAHFNVYSGLITRESLKQRHQREMFAA
jgi:hypothetical protein